MSNEEEQRKIKDALEVLTKQETIDVKKTEMLAYALSLLILAACLAASSIFGSN